MTVVDVKLAPETRGRIAAVIDFEAAVERFKRAVVAGDVEFIDSMTALVDNMTGVPS